MVFVQDVFITQICASVKYFENVQHLYMSVAYFKEFDRLYYSKSIFLRSVTLIYSALAKYRRPLCRRETHFWDYSCFSHFRAVRNAVMVHMIAF
jgi:hypothetical protein